MGLTSSEIRVYVVKIRLVYPNLANFGNRIDYTLYLMSQSIPTGYIRPRENFFERANPGHPGNFFCLIPCPGAKNDGRIPGGGAKFFPKSKKLLLKLAKNP